MASIWLLQRQPYWTQPGNTDTAYLCFKRRWIISRSLCSSWKKDKKVYCDYGEPDLFAGCVNASSSASYSQDTSVSIINAKCSDPAAFTFEDNWCLAENPQYTEEICINAAALLFDEVQVNFVVYSDVCVNGKSVYSYTVYKEEDVEDVYETEEVIVVDEEGNNVQESSIEKKYFLHYTTFGEWVITRHRISGFLEDRLAVCHYENLMECEENAWFVHNITVTESTTGEGNYSMSEAVMVIKEVEDQTMTVNEYECGWEGEEKEEGKEDGDANATKVSMIILIVVACILLSVCVCGFVWYKNKTKRRGKVEWKKDVDEVGNTEIEVLETGVTA